jgi:hypothetical protein
MRCSNCGRRNEVIATVCVSCGQPLAPAQQVARKGAVDQGYSTIEQGRGSTILFFGILSIIIAGLFTGIPAWVMARRDLKKMKSGRMSGDDKRSTFTGMIFGIIGIFLNPVLWALSLILLLRVTPQL